MLGAEMMIDTGMRWEPSWPSYTVTATTISVAHSHSLSDS
jgi:hypothetical protein